MSDKRKIAPPRWATRLLRWYCKPSLLEDLEGDLNEYFQRNIKNKNAGKARFIYIIDVIKFFRLYTVRKPEFINLLINWVMLRSHIKTSVRSIARNKLFSTINIVGLAIGMSVGLLLIAFANDLLSFDKFNEKGGRIYLIISKTRFKQGYSSTFATTSVKTDRLIKEKVTGVEETTMLQAEFAGDANINGNIVPLKGFYAEPSILRIFTLPMLKGNASTALTEPYSIILTETSAKKLFGSADAFGKTVHLKDIDYKVTGILKDVPFFSHLQFESLVSFSTIEPRIAKNPDLLKWGNVYQRNYVYVLLEENASASDIQTRLDAICTAENRLDKDAQVQLTLLPLHDIMMGEDLENSIRPVMPRIVLWVIGGLALIVILSACFNYTNLSIARSMRRCKEVGLRKVIGAGGSQVRTQFLTEAVIVSLVALLLSLGMFLLLRPQFITIAPELLKMVKLEITLPMVLLFIAFAMAVGIVAGFLPALFFAKVNIIHALRDVSSVKVFKRISFRRALVVVQYTLTLIFITSTVIGYVQYKKIIAFDLGFST
jgi:ABC-type antimicrobial peptide transport system permease subunit